MSKAQNAKAVETLAKLPEPVVEPLIQATHEMFFSIIKATGLTPKPGSATANPICKFWIISVNGPLEGSDRKTARAVKTLNPEWNDSFSVKILDPLWEVLRIEIYDGELSNPVNFMGLTEVSCGEMLGMSGAGAWDMSLEASQDPRAADAVVTGQLSIIVTNTIELAGNGSGASGGAAPLGASLDGLRLSSK